MRRPAHIVVARKPRKPTRVAAVPSLKVHGIVAAAAAGITKRVRHGLVLRRVAKKNLVSRNLSDERDAR